MFYEFKSQYISIIELLGIYRWGGEEMLKDR